MVRLASPLPTSSTMRNEAPAGSWESETRMAGGGRVGDIGRASERQWTDRELQTGGLVGQRHQRMVELRLVQLAPGPAGRVRTQFVRHLRNSGPQAIAKDAITGTCRIGAQRGVRVLEKPDDRRYAGGIRRDDIHNLRRNRGHHRRPETVA